LELEPNDPYIYEHLGDTYNALGNQEKSLYYYQKSLEILTDSDSRNSILEKIQELNEN
jgi:tetratricopeptide (TPR) repeat protein